jgi:hypothetical protein
MEVKMGRETLAVARWRGAVEEVKALLESQEIILRGAIKARIARGGISNIAVEGDELTLCSEGELLTLELGAIEAAKWHDTLLKPPPSLTKKLGIGPHSRVFVIGNSDDGELNDALAGAICASPGEANILLAIIKSPVGLAAAFAVAKQHPQLFLWCVFNKGKAVEIGDTAVRAFLRERGYVDSKSCAVSAQLTATRYGLKVRPV